MKRHKPLRSDPEKTRAWRERSKPLRGGVIIDRVHGLGRAIRSWPIKLANKIVGNKSAGRADEIPRAVREAVLRRSGGRCERCGVPGLHLHHLITRGQGGPDTVENLVHLCFTCHRQVHASPKDSFLAGWLYSGKWSRDFAWRSILERRQA